MTKRIELSLILSSAALAMGIGCAPRWQVFATNYHVKVHLDPAEHSIVGRATLTLKPIEEGPLPEGKVAVGIDLNADLVVADIRADTAKVLGVRSQRPHVKKGDDPVNYRTHIVTLDHAPSHLALSIDYRGKLYQDVEAGEKRGEIHNFQMSAHIGPEGTYLAPGGNWYPTPAIDRPEERDPALFLADWRLEADRVVAEAGGSPAAPYALVAGAHRDESTSDLHVWTSPHKLLGMTLTGGPHDVWSREAAGVDIRVHMKHVDDEQKRQANKEIAQRYLDQTAAYIERYEPLIGPFPYDEYTIIENFFSSGFAFPTMTLFGPTVMHMGDNSFRHGYLDHELVHSWWGCGIEVDRRDGNWCEALTSYATNYFGFVLDGDEEGARKKRRNQSNFLSRMKPENDKPLGTYGRPDGVGRGIAYSKGAAVFHMIARTIGQENFWAAMRRLTEGYVGRSANWDDLKRVFEEAGDRDLDAFFDQWVRRGGAPMLTLGAAQHDPSTESLSIEIDQGETAFVVDVPLRIHFQDGYEDVLVSVSQPSETFTIPVSRSPRLVELDPDYHVFRKLRPAEIMPTTATTKAGKRLTVVVPPGELLEPYETAAEDFREVIEKKDGQINTIVADDSLGDSALVGGGAVLILGKAVHHPVVKAFLARTGCPVRWDADGFDVDGQRFDKPEHSILCTVHHPDAPAAGVTVYMGNSEDALVNAGILGFYANSMLVYEAHDRAEVVLRRDFESHQRTEVTHLSAD